MFTPTELALFALASLVLVLTPGPNMLYCISRTLCQGRRAGMVSLGGVLVGFLSHLGAAALGLTALLAAVPVAFDALRLAGAAYLLWMAWQALAADAAPLQVRELPQDSAGRLFRMGLLTSVLNPKVAMFYVSFFPQFLHPERGSVLQQTLVLGFTQITVSGLVNAALVLSAARLTAWLSRSEGWLKVQRYIMASVLGLLAVRIATEGRKA